MRISLSIEITKNPNTKKLFRQLDRATDELIREMSEIPVPQPSHDINGESLTASSAVNEVPTAASGRRVQIPVRDGNKRVRTAPKKPTRASVPKKSVKKSK